MTPLMLDRLESALLAVGMVLFLAALRYFKKIDWRLLQWSVRTSIAGTITGAVLLVAPSDRGELNAFVTGTLLTVAVISLRGREGDWIDGLLTGSLVGVGAGAVQLIVPIHAHDTEILRTFLAGSLAGVGSHTAIHVRRRWMWPLWILTALVASLATVIPHLPSIYRFDPRSLTIVSALGIGVLVAIIVLRRWPVVVAELRQEASLGFFDGHDIASVAHPLRRMYRGVWRDAPARRRFVERANELALRKHEQRKMPPDAARLYQLEILKLRMELQELARVRDAMRLSASGSPAGAHVTGPRQE